MQFSAPKLIDCEGHGRRSELFVVEGDSAARTLARICNPAFQAILPMQGKPINTLKAGLSDIRSNRQFAALIEALGIELAENGLELNALTRIRYQNVILLFDPDADGIHGRTLMLFFFYRWLRPLLDAGRIFDSYAPQWVLTGDGLAHPLFATTPEFLEKLRDYLRQQGVMNIRSRRFRGLGNVGGEILQAQRVDPKTRKLMPLSVNHAQNALAIFEQMRSLRRD